MKECINCKTILEDDELFCHACGAKQEIEEVEVKPEEQSVEEKFCVHCGKAIEADSMFCPYCGKPQDVEETKSEEPQPKAEETEPEQEKPQTEGPNVKEEPNVEESSKEEPMAEEDPVYEMEEKKKSKTWIWILLGVILLGIIGAGYYFLTQTDDTPKTEENDVVIATSLDETTLPSDPKEFLNSLYNDFYEQGNSDRFDEAVLSKYFTKGAMRKFYVEDSYEEGHYFYCTDFLTHGTISGGPDPDYGDKIVYRLIVTENDGWFKVTNIWDVIKEPVIVHLQVKTIDGALKIVDVRVENDYTEDSSVEFDRESVEKELKAFLAEYVNTLNDNIFAYLSDDFKGVIKKWESTPNVGEWNLFGLNSAAEIRKYTIESLTEPVDDQLCANVKIWIENEEDYYEDETNIYLIHVDDKWLVDEIDEVKQNMKTALSKL